ncbi:HET-domain-containing protein [Nemania diffusa]|nr:HET-domain-containing protein [Nemania diffusa]
MDSLCDICQTIPFRELQEDPCREIAKFDLGDYDDVKQRVSCVFCCLASRSVLETSRLLGYSDNNIGEYIRKYWIGTSIEVQWRHRDQLFEVNGFPLRYTRGPSRSLGRIVHSGPVAVDPITSLLRECETSHECSLSVSEEDASRLSTLRAIDINQMCITSILPSARYVALSYVWGAIPVPYLLRANKEELMMPGGLEAYQSRMPLTISDAIKLVRKMNFDYLWVDALCLVQDDKDDMAIGINAMSIIYEHAYFTIVAADGSNADAGLAGVSPRKVSQITAEVLPGVELVGTLAVGEELSLAYYSKRAWTFQEFHLSRRKLIFHNNMVYYQCMKGSWSEDIKGLPIASRIRHRALAPTQPDKLFLEFTIILEEYSIRNATHQHDIVNAVASIYYRILGRKYGRHIFGVPVVAFDSFMCFYCPETHLTYLERRGALPSWAWTGWSGNVVWTDKGDDNDTLMWNTDCTWIIWYMRNPVGSLNLMWDLSKCAGNRYTASSEQICAKRIAALQRFSATPLPIMPSRIIPHTFDLRYDLLQFWTFSAHFSLRVDVEGENYLSSRKFLDWKVAQQIFGPDDKYYGFIYMDEESSLCDHGTVELIAISESAQVVSHDYHAFYRNKHWSKLTREKGGCWYNVMYIEERLGIAERKGFGQIYCNEIHVSPESMWEWKEMVLA